MSLQSADAVVSGLFVYPLKGGRGTALAAAELDELGFRDDRRWMIVDSAGEFVSQRTHPRLALVAPEVRDEAIVINAPGMEPLTVPLPDGRARVTVQLFRDSLEADLAGDVADAWVSDFLGLPARLVHFAAGAVRRVDPEYARRPTDQVAFVDAYPCLLISEASLAELNRRLEAPLPMERFRPNLVVTGTAPHAEDGWRRICIGGVAFDVVKPCARCTVPTVDQRTGIPGDEPLRTLATYRKVGSKVMFGQNLIHGGAGRVAIGDEVRVVE